MKGGTRNMLVERKMESPEEGTQLSDSLFEHDLPLSPAEWKIHHVAKWLESKSHPAHIIRLLCNGHDTDGKTLLLMNENDLKQPPLSIQNLGDVKRLYFDILSLQHSFITLEQVSNPRSAITYKLGGCSAGIQGLSDDSSKASNSGWFPRSIRKKRYICRKSCVTISPTTTTTEESSIPSEIELEDTKRASNSKDGSPSHCHHHGNGHPIRSPKMSRDATNIKPEFGKTLVSLVYLFLVTWITALVMVIVHDRVPDMERYPPLPDLFLDNMPHIPWAFEMCEVTGTVLFLMFSGVLFFHRHRFVLLRRFFALSGTVFLLRCFTMLITSLSVPGTHLKCNPRPYGDWMNKLYNAYMIWRGAGMSIQGVRTCGDYMFSGHTVALTMLNFFITEYTPRKWYFIHTFSWLLNLFGIFFILAAHEHYSIDVFIAFYITSRLFLYYHTLSNNQALMQRDSKRTKIWFPLFSYFESGVNGIVPNKYEWPITPNKIKKILMKLYMTARKKWNDKIKQH